MKGWPTGAGVLKHMERCRDQSFFWQVLKPTFVQVCKPGTQKETHGTKSRIAIYLYECDNNNNHYHYYNLHRHYHLY